MSTDSEIRERLLNAAWKEIRAWDPGNVVNVPAARRAVEAGAAPEDLARAMGAAAYEAVFRLLFLLAAEHSEEGSDKRTGWMLVGADISPMGGAVPRSGTDLDFVHEDLLSADPTGDEGQDLFA